MICDLEPYAAHKDSGVPWLGKVPEHWEVDKVKHLSRAAYKTFVDGDWIESPFIASEGIRLIQTGNIGVGAYREKGFRYISQKTFDALGCTEFMPNDVLICRLGEPVGRACLAPQLGVRMITSVDVCILKPREDVSAAFVVYAMSSPQYLDWVGSLVRGSTRDRVSRSMLGGFVIPVPPLPEQSAIVRFLDHADRRIRRYIRAKQKLIKLLGEQKQAIIHRAVTRGLGPNVRLKPSGVEWIGDVPHHWGVVRLGRFIRLTTGFPFESDGFSQSQHDVRLLRGINVAPGRVRWDAVVRWPTADRATFADYELMPGDIVLGMDRPIIGGGVRVAMISEEDVPSLLLQRVARIRPLDDLDAKFALLLLNGKTFSDYLSPIFTGISVPHVSPEQIGAFRLGLPSKVEQAVIVAWVTGATAAIDTAVASANREISLLREYRTRLIADVVTGKVDVRSAAASLPDEPEEGEADAFADDESGAADDEPQDQEPADDVEAV